MFRNKGVAQRERRDAFCSLLLSTTATESRARMLPLEHQQKKRTWNRIGVVQLLSLMQPAAQQQHDKRLDSIVTKRIVAEPSLLLNFSSDVIHNV